MTLSKSEIQSVEQSLIRATQLPLLVTDAPETSVTFDSIGKSLTAILQGGAAQKLSTAMLLNRDLKGNIWDWLPISPELQLFLTETPPLDLPNKQVQAAIEGISFGLIAPESLKLDFLDPAGIFTQKWAELKDKILELFLHTKNGDKKSLILHFMDVYNTGATTEQKSSLAVAAFVDDFCTTYVGMLQGQYYGLVDDKLTANVTNTDELDLLGVYYSHLIKQLFEKTKDEVIREVAKGIAKELDAKPISSAEKAKFIALAYKLFEGNLSLSMRNMLEDIKDFYSSPNITYSDGNALFRVLSENYKNAPDCCRLLKLFTRIELSEPIEKSIADIYKAFPHLSKVESKACGIDPAPLPPRPPAKSTPSAH